MARVGPPPAPRAAASARPERVPSTAACAQSHAAPRAHDLDVVAGPSGAPSPKWVGPRASHSGGARATALSVLQVEGARIDKGALRQARKLAFAALDPADPTTAFDAASAWADAMDHVVRVFDRQTVDRLGPPPDHPDTGRPIEYGLFAAGSYARREVSPYSDVDYGLVIEAETPAARDYFRRYAEAFAACFAELDDPALAPCTLVSPTGTFGDAFIATPETLAQRSVGTTPDLRGHADVPQRAPRDRAYFMTALNSTRLIGGSPNHERLFDRFALAQRKALGPPAPAVRPGSGRAAVMEVLGQSLRDPFGVPDLPEDWMPEGEATKHHAPLSPAEALAKGQVNVKHDLLKALQFPLYLLRAAFGIEALDGPGLLRDLVARNKIDEGFADKIERVLASCLALRLQSHQAHGAGVDQLGELSAADKRTLERAVPLIYRLRQLVDQPGSGGLRLSKPAEH